MIFFIKIVNAIIFLLATHSAVAIVGGKKADHENHKWQVLIMGSSSRAKDRCGGVIISPRHILTAAHCKPSAVKYNSKVYIGNHGGEELAEVSQFISHKGYTHSAFSAHDIALIITKAPMDMKKVSAISLPESVIYSSEMDKWDGFFQATGYGKTEIYIDENKFLRDYSSYPGNQLLTSQKLELKSTFNLEKLPRTNHPFWTETTYRATRRLIMMFPDVFKQSSSKLTINQIIDLKLEGKVAKEGNPWEQLEDSLYLIFEDPNNKCDKFDNDPYNFVSSSVHKGDSGGPLVYTNNKGEKLLVGLASTIQLGKDCISENKFTNVSMYLDWIKEKKRKKYHLN